MKLTIERKALKEAVDKAALFAPVKSTLPHLETLRFSANGKLQIEATDLEAFIRVIVPNKAERDGTATFPAKLLQDAVARNSAKTLSIDVPPTPEEDRYEIGILKGEKSDVQMSIEKIEFPTIETAIPEDAARFVIGRDMLQVLAKKATPLVSTDELRRAMMGVLFRYDQKTLTAYGTDGHRLIRMSLPFAGGEMPWEFIIPAKQLTNVVRVMGDIIHVAVSPDFAWFDDGATLVQVRLIDERYPNIEAVIPRDNENLLFVDKQQFKAAINSVVVWANRSTTQLILHLEQNEITVLARNFDAGAEARETVPAIYEAPELTIGFNGRFLLSALDLLNGDEAMLKLSAPTRAVVLEEVTGGMEVLMLVMPVRLEGYVWLSTNAVAEQRIQAIKEAEERAKARQLEEEKERAESANAMASEPDNITEDEALEAEEADHYADGEEDPDDDEPEDVDEESDSDDVIGA